MGDGLCFKGHFAVESLYATLLLALHVTHIHVGYQVRDGLSHIPYLVWEAGWGAMMVIQ